MFSSNCTIQNCVILLHVCQYWCYFVVNLYELKITVCIKCKKVFLDVFCDTLNAQMFETLCPWHCDVLILTHEHVMEEEQTMHTRQSVLSALKCAELEVLTVSYYHYIQKNSKFLNNCKKLNLFACNFQSKYSLRVLSKLSNSRCNWIYVIIIALKNENLCSNIFKVL